MRSCVLLELLCELGLILYVAWPDYPLRKPMLT